MSNIKIGDKVRFLNSIGGGIVRSFKGKDQVLVEDEDGFEVPTFIRECVVVGDNDMQVHSSRRSPLPSVEPTPTPQHQGRECWVPLPGHQWRQSVPPAVSKFLILTTILQKFRLLRRKGSCHSCVFQHVLHQVLLGGRLTLQFTCFRNGLWRESFLALTRGNQAESIPLP